MDEDFAGSLSLNTFDTSFVPNPRKKRKSLGERPSQDNQKEDFKAGKSGEKTPHSQVKSANANRTDGRKRVWADRTEENGSPALKKKAPDTVISSLFRKNPEIPLISSTEVDTVTENVFTGQTFRDLPIHPYLVSNLEEKQGFKEMTEVQKMSIPVLLKRKDCLIKSQTGSGKTLAYAVPIVHSLQSRKLKVRRDDGPYVLVIVPTRELALQSYDTFVKLLRTFIWIVPGCLMGGEKRKPEKARLRKGVNILVATPGRLMDHIKTTSVLSLARIQWLVIDEADRLLELGYERDIAQIINALKDQCPDPPQTVLVSATLSEGVERLSSISLNDPERISVTDGSSGPAKSPQCHQSDQTPLSSHNQDSLTDREKQENFTVPSQLKQYFVISPCKQRLVTLAALVLWKCQYSKPASKMIVFLSTQDSVEFHHSLFSQVLGSQRNIKETLTSLALGDEDVGDSDDEEEIVDGYEEENVKGKNSKGQKKGKKLKMFKLHGDMAQKDRSQVFSEFSQTTSGVLFCTDVAARGLDLPHVDWIVQYTSPGATVDYIHRVGRTARAGTKGQSLLFLMPSEADYIQELNKHKISLSQLQPSTLFQHLLENISHLPPPDSMNTTRETPCNQEEAATYLQDRFEERVVKNKQMQSLAGKGFQSYVRAYATYSKEVKDIFKVSDLHLGHVAKSFALREAPTKVHGVTAKFGIGQRKNKKYEKPSKRPLSFKQATLSEYSDGIQSRSNKTMARPGGKMKQRKRKLKR